MHEGAGYTTIRYTKDQSGNDALIGFQHFILKEIARGADHKSVLNKICQLGEELVPGSIASIMLYDQQRGVLNAYCAPNATQQMLDCLQGIVPGPESGSCGNAIYTGKPVFVDDPQHDPRWVRLYSVAREFNLGRCWSVPVFADSGEVIGTFALTGFESRLPTAFHVSLLEVAASTISIVLEQQRKQQLIELERDRFYQLFEHAIDGKFLLSEDGVILELNHVAHERLGYRKEEMLGRRIVDFVTADNVDKVGQRLKTVSLNNFATYESAQVRRDGTILPVEVSTVLLDLGEQSVYYSIVRDISERKRAEDTLSRSERRFRDLVETSSDWIWETDAELRYTYLSPRVQQILGYAPEELIGKTPYDLMPAQERSAKRQMLDQVGRGGPIDQFESTRMSKDGSPVIVETSGVAFHDADGTFKGYRGVTRDITHRRRLELSLVENEARLRSIMQHAPIGLAVVSLEGRFLEVNRSLCEIVGYAEEELVRLTFQQITHPADLASDLDNVNRLLAGEIPHYKMEKRYIRKDGELVWIQLTVSLLHDATGAPSYFIAQIEDISERKAFELRLKTERNFSNSILDTAKSIIMVMNGAGEITRINRAGLEFTGYSWEEIRERPFVWERFLLEEQRQDIRGVFRKLMNGEGASRYENYWVRKDGSRRLFDWSNSLITDEAGAAQYLVTVGIDITDKHEYETRLRLVSSVFTHAHEGMMITDAAGSILEVNDTFTSITGYARQEVIDKTPAILKSGMHGPEFYQQMWQSLTDSDMWAGEIWNRRKNGEIYPELRTISVVRDVEGNVQNFISLFSDISTIKEYQRKLEFIAHNDPLTGLPNRLLLTDRLSHAMYQSERHDRGLAVVYLDLDGFKFINDSYGHDVGDAFLVSITKRMKDVLRGGDTLSRMGGDEFVAVLVDLVRPQDCKPALQRLLQAASQPLLMDGLRLQVSASIGVTLYPQDRVDADQLVRHADQAMYRAKQLGKNQFQFYAQDTESSPAQR
jgi:diguanylate cyclase (GGDEF)-like protein/PAS domain S-box-containing protein